MLLLSIRIDQKAKKNSVLIFKIFGSYFFQQILQQQDT